LKYRGENVIGFSDYSEVIEVALVSLPLATSAPTKVLELSNETELTVSWTDPLSITLPGGRILEY